MNEEEQDFAKAANPKTICPSTRSPTDSRTYPDNEPEPELLPAEPEKPKSKTNDGDSEEGFLGMSQENESENETPDLQPKPDPAAEHKVNKMNGLLKLVKLKKNQLLQERFEQLSNKTRRILEWFTPESDFEFEEQQMVRLMDND